MGGLNATQGRSPLRVNLSYVKNCVLAYGQEFILPQGILFSVGKEHQREASGPNPNLICPFGSQLSQMTIGSQLTTWLGFSVRIKILSNWEVKRFENEFFGA